VVQEEKMLTRFASAVCVASPAAALATVVALLVAEPRSEALYRLTSLWCIVPAGWGVWAMLAPRTWVPKHLPSWGALLGLLVGSVVIFALDLPAQFLREPPPASVRGLVVLILAAFYYCLWMVVRRVFGVLARGEGTTG
jgi:hypothetical protein